MPCVPSNVYLEDPMRRFPLFVCVAAIFLSTVACDQGSIYEDPGSPNSRQSAPPANQRPVVPPPAPANLPEPVDGLDATFTVPVANDSPLWNPKSPEMTATAPDKYLVTFETTRGDVTIEVDRSLSPAGVDRFYNLTRHGFYDGARFFRVLPGFMAQFGLPGEPKLTNIWMNQKIADEPVKVSNTKGTISFAMAGPNTRTTQVFINYADNSAALDRQGFTPFGKVVEGMEHVEALYNAYGEGSPRGNGPDQMQLMRAGNEYLSKWYPNLDYIIRTNVKVPGADGQTQPGNAASPEAADESADDSPTMSVE
jgi:peptidyl-prolyl cis-trans isomerase A (cyclophilin A)